MSGDATGIKATAFNCPISHVYHSNPATSSPSNLTNLASIAMSDIMCLEESNFLGF